MTILARVRTVFTGVPGTPWYSNIYFEDVAGSPQSIIDAVGDFWTTLNPLIFTNVLWTVQAEVANINDATGEIVSVETGVAENGDGSNTTEPLPYANQAVVNWNTNAFLGGRRLRGKTFVPGLTQTANDNGVLLASTRTSIQAAATTLIAAVPGVMRVFSPTNLTSAPVLTATTSTRIGVLRSRRD